MPWVAVSNYPPHSPGAYTSKPVSGETESNPSQPPPEGSEALRSPENGSQGVSEGTGPGQTAETAGGSAAVSDERYLSREQTNYRRRMKAAEAERDKLREQLDRLQRGQVEAIAGEAGLQVPGDIWTFHPELAAMRGEDGMIDADTVRALVDDIVKARPGLKAPPVGVIGIGRGATAAGPRRAKVGLSSLLKP